MLKVSNLIRACHFNHFVRQPHRLSLEMCPLYIRVVKHAGVRGTRLHCDETYIPSLVLSDPCRICAILSTTEQDCYSKRHLNYSMLKRSLFSNCLSYNCWSRCSVPASSGPLSSLKREIRANLRANPDLYRGLFGIPFYGTSAPKVDLTWTV